MSKFTAYGMCNPIYDIQCQVSEETLATFGYQKGSTFLISLEAKKDVLRRTCESVVNSESGGSGANSMITVALLGGKACYTGCVGNDDHATLYRDSLRNKGVQPNLGSVDGETGVCTVLLTPDAERTMLTYLGASVNLAPSHINWDDLKQSDYLYITGYLWDTDSQKETVMTALEAAKKAGVKVAFSLSDGFCVTRHGNEFGQIIQEYVDVLFGNADEARTLTGIEDPEEATASLGGWTEIVAITVGSQGSIISADSKISHVPSYPVVALDATGAGDTYAGAFLFGLSQGWDTQKSARLASHAASQVVAQLGPRIGSLDLELVSWR
jgi:sugar/nucleoside kinase (ribokinase family)